MMAAIFTIGSVMLNLAIALDQMINVLVWLKSEGFGKPDETLSARAWRLRHDSIAYKFINLLFFWQDNHCLNSYISEMERRHLPKEYRSG